jgi:plastocyanin
MVRGADRPRISTSCGLASWNSAPTKAARLGAAGGISLFFAAAAETPSAGETAIKIAVNPAAIRIDNFSYPPPTLVVAPGTTVTWTNADDSPHTVREKDGKFKSAALDTDDTFSQTFTAPGEYEYFCSIHPRMVGKVVVKPAGSSS